MLDVTDNELTVTVRVPEGRWLWLVSLRAGLPLAEWPSLYAHPISVGLSSSVSPDLSGYPPSQVHHGRGSRSEPLSPAGGRKWEGRLDNRKEKRRGPEQC